LKISPDMLDDGEEVVDRRRPHWTFMAGAVGLVIVGVLFAVAISVIRPALMPLALLAVLVVLVGAGGQFLQWRSIEVVLTNRRLLSRRGFIAEDTFEAPLERILHTSHHQGVLGRLFNFGTIEVETAGEQGERFYSDVESPGEFEREIYHYVEVVQNDMGPAAASGGLGNSAPKAPATMRPKQRRGTKLTLEQRIERLVHLKQRNLITDEDFEAKKRKLIDAL
jgi:membrane protein YdbS with pleckstrin-like domain